MWTFIGGRPPAGVALMEPTTAPEGAAMSGWAVRELADAETEDAVGLLARLRPDTVDLPRVVGAAVAQRVRYLGAHEQTGGLVALAGWCIVACARGRILHVEDLVTEPQWRGRGAAGALLSWLERAAAVEGCQALELDSGVTNNSAHRFYARAGFSISAFHFAKPVARTS